MGKKVLLRVSAVILICIFGLSACKKNVGTPEDNAVTEEVQEDEMPEEDVYVFGFTGIDMENPYFITLESAIREKLETEGPYSLITKDPASDPDLQAQQIREMIEEGKQVYDKPFGKNLVYRKDAPHEPEHLPGAKQMIRNLLEQLLISLYRKQQECPAQVQSLPMQSLGMEYQIVRQVVTFLDQNIYNNITFVDVASHFNLSETQLKKLFREVTGYSVMQYYRKSVVGRIEYHIRQMDKNFTELADLFNFSSIHYFSKFYKRESGHTLREYLKSSQDVSLP